MSVRKEIISKLGTVKSKAKEIADAIKTLEEFRYLEKELNKAEKTTSKYVSEVDSEIDWYWYEVMQEAWVLAEKKKYQWQYIPEINLFTPSKVLKHAYKIFSNEEYEKLKNSVGRKTDWYSLYADDKGEIPDSSLSELLKFRSIVEGNKSREETIKAINNLVSPRSKFAKEFFSYHLSLSPGDQWFALNLDKEGMPLAFQMYAEGFDSADKCLEINPDTFIQRKGVGPKKLEQLKKFQLKIKRSSHKSSAFTIGCGVSLQKIA